MHMAVIFNSAIVVEAYVVRMRMNHLARCTYDLRMTRFATNFAVTLHCTFRVIPFSTFLNEFFLHS